MPDTDILRINGTDYKIHDSDGRALVAPEELTSTAAAAHAVGELFVYDGKLCRATAAIAIGDPIVTTGADANVAAVPGGVTGEVANLKSALASSMVALSDTTGTKLVTELQQNSPLIETNVIFAENVEVGSSVITKDITVTPGKTYTIKVADISGEAFTGKAMSYAGLDEQGNTTVSRTYTANGEAANISKQFAATADTVTLRIWFSERNHVYNATQVIEGSTMTYTLNDLIHVPSSDNGAEALNKIDNFVSGAVDYRGQSIPADGWEPGLINSSGEKADQTGFYRTKNKVIISNGTIVSGVGNNGRIAVYNIISGDFIALESNGYEAPYDALVIPFVYKSSAEAASAQVTFSKNNYIIRFSSLPIEALYGLIDTRANNAYMADRNIYGYRQHRPIGNMYSFAHRGNAGMGAPENTWWAYRDASRRGFYGVEGDLRMASDDVPMICHDANLSNCGNLQDINGYLMYTDGTTYYYYDAANETLYTYENGEYVESAVALSGLTRLAGSTVTIAGTPSTILKRIDYGVHAGAQYAGKGLMDLYEYMICCKRFNVVGMIDVKSGPSNTDDYITWATYAKKIGVLKNLIWVGLAIPTINKIINVGHSGFAYLTVNSYTLLASYAQDNYCTVYCYPYDWTNEALEACIAAGVHPGIWFTGNSVPDETVIELVEKGVQLLAADGKRLEDICY